MTLRRQLLFMLADGCCVVFSAICFCIGKGRANCFNNLKYAEIIELFLFLLLIVIATGQLDVSIFYSGFCLAIQFLPGGLRTE